MKKKTWPAPTHRGPNRAERRARIARHTVKVPQTQHHSDAPTYVLVRMTSRRPWTVRAERRAANKRARISRKANRRA